jgi:hypothetical protein
VSFCRASSTATSTTESITNTISDAANYVKESVVGASAEQKKEADKFVVSSFLPRLVLMSVLLTTRIGFYLIRAQAKDSSNSLTDRASAGISALGNKADEEKASTKASGYKSSAQH